MPRLIVNADDFGLTPGVNRAIGEAHQQGIVTSATLMANSKEFAAAVALSKQLPALGVGCHTVLLDGELLTAAPSLRPGGTARSGIASFAAPALAGRIRPDDVAAEALAQMRKIRGAGVALTHFDSHKHTHIFPGVLRPLLQAAKEAGIPAVRNPFEALAMQPIASLTGGGRMTRYLEVKALGAFAATFRRAVAEAGLRTPDGCFGVVATGSLDEAALLRILDAVPEGTWELVCHPGYDDAALAAVATRLRASRAVELAALTSPAVKQRLRERNIQLIHFGEL